ncbi:MAG TPA: ribonuclease III [Candidatus Sulfotelmatobacter sp.]|nr:ribonuclease III [Candidatus Sulfotelmatobacter sp.]
MKEREITALEEGLGYHFRRRAVLEQAVTHSSQAREQEAQRAGESKYQVSDNEQLEFLGDSVLALVTSEELFHRFPHFREGELSKLRAHLVSEKHLIRAAQRLELGHYLRLGRGEEKSGGRGKTALLVDALEAILAAIYLDGGLEVAREFVRRNVLLPELESMDRDGGMLPVTDFKSALQEAVQSLGLPQPAYVLVDEAGPEHSKTFTVEARLLTKNNRDPEFVGRAQGSTKKTAEQDAARQLLTFLASRPKPAESKARAGAGSPVDK